MIIPLRVNMSVSESAHVFPLTVSEQNVNVSMNIATSVVSSVYADYYGPYEVTPSQSTQTLFTENKRATGNIIINPIPSNYGLITWNGSALTVS